MSGQSASRRPANKIRLPKVDAAPAEPRALADITADYNQAAVRLGQAVYQQFVFQQEAERLQDEMLALNQEAAARNELDKAAESKEIKTEETPSEQS
jgi:hypothetical protein